MKRTGMPVSLWVFKFRISVSLAVLNRIGHVLNEQGTGYEHIFSWCEYSISIELKMGLVI